MLVLALLMLLLTAVVKEVRLTLVAYPAAAEATATALDAILLALEAINPLC